MYTTHTDQFIHWSSKKKLTILNLKDNKNLVSLPNNILALNSLKCLSLSDCSKLNSICLLDEARDVENLNKSCMGEARLILIQYYPS